MTSVAFRVSALEAEPYAPLFSLSDAELAARSARRCVVDSSPGYPCRVSLVDANLGEAVIALPYTHHTVAGPYNGSGPIFVREHAQQAQFEVGEIPDLLEHRLLSVRGYNPEGLMVNAKVVSGGEVRATIQDFFQNESIAYLHLHNAAPGCYMCNVERI